MILSPPALSPHFAVIIALTCSGKFLLSILECWCGDLCSFSGKSIPEISYWVMRFSAPLHSSCRCSVGLVRTQSGLSTQVLSLQLWKTMSSWSFASLSGWNMFAVELKRVISRPFSCVPVDKQNQCHFPLFRFLMFHAELLDTWILVFVLLIFETKISRWRRYLDSKGKYFKHRFKEWKCWWLAFDSHSHV